MEAEEPLAGLVRRLLTQAGHVAADRAGYGVREGGGTTVRAGFTIRAKLSDTLPETADPTTIIVRHRPRYDDDPERKSREEQYAAVLRAAGLEVDALSRYGSGIVVRRKSDVAKM